MAKTITKPDAGRICDILERVYPGAECALVYDGDPWRLLVAARLSAQCTDETVNKVTAVLFEKYPDMYSLVKAKQSDVETIIRPCGIFRMKAANIIDASRMIADVYGGRVPDNMDDLLKLPGVGRKIANLVLGDYYGLGGIVADTHCIRICGRLGFYDEDKKDPLLTERTMEKLIPREKQSDFCHRIILLGREYCGAKRPECSSCPLKDECRRNISSQLQS